MSTASHVKKEPSDQEQTTIPIEVSYKETRPKYGTKSNIVILHNDLINAHKQFSAPELRLFLLYVEQVKESDPMDKLYKIEIARFAELADFNTNNMYTRAAAISKKLQSRVWHIPTKNGFIQISPISFAEYQEGKGYVEVRSDVAMRPYLIELNRRFTKLSKKVIFNLKTGYSMNLQMLLQQWAFRGWFEIEVDELRKVLGCEDKYKTYGEFKKKIILKAQKEYKEKGIMSFTLAEIEKKRKKVLKVRFDIVSTLPKQLPQSTKKAPQKDLTHDERTIINKLKEWGEIKDTLCLKLIKDHGAENVWGHILVIEKKHHDKENKIGYLRTCLKNGNPKYAVTPSEEAADKKAKKAFEEKRQRERQWPQILRKLESEYSEFRGKKIDEAIKSITKEEETLFEIYYSEKTKENGFKMPRAAALSGWIAQRRVNNKIDSFQTWAQNKGFIVEKYLLNNEYERWKITGEQLNLLNEIPS